MWSDNEADADLLGFQHLAVAVTDIVRDEDLLPASIGVYGDWGSGKSSLLRMIEKDLNQDKGTLVLWFNGWLFEGFDDAKTALMGTIVDEIIARKSLKTQGTDVAKKLAFKILKRIPIFRLMNAGVRAAGAYAFGGKAAATASVAADGVGLWNDFTQKSQKALEKAEEMSVEDISEALGDDSAQSLRRGVREFRDDFAKLLEASEISRLVVMIDDLDRCSPDTVIETLEAIKLFLFVPRTAFIIGADERLVRYAVRRRFPELPGENVEVGRDYLEKLVQFPVRVPPLGRTEMETYINLLFTRKAKDVTPEQFGKARACVTESTAETLFSVRYNHAVAQQLFSCVSKELGEHLAVAEKVAPVLAAGLLGNPRQCKRFLNVLMMRTKMAKTRGFDLKQRVFVKLMLLEYFHTESFRNLAEAQAKNEGRPPELAVVEQLVKSGQSSTSTRQADDEADSDGKKSSARKSTKREDAVVLPPWLEDPALKDWLASEPALAPEDLRPYFFVARDRLLHTLGTSEQRMSPAAQELLQRLLEPGKAALKTTLAKAKELSPVDAAAVLQALSERARREDDPGDENSALSRVLEWAKARTELVGQALTILHDLPEDNLPLSLPPLLIGLANSDQEKAVALKVLEKWSKSTVNGRLKTAAQSQLQRQTGK